MEKKKKLSKPNFSHIFFREIEGTYSLQLDIVGLDGKQKWGEPRRYTLSDIDGQRAGMIAMNIFDEWVKENFEDEIEFLEDGGDESQPVKKYDAEKGKGIDILV